MNDFIIVASALVVFLGLGIAMGMLTVAAFSRRRKGAKYLKGGEWQEPRKLPEDDEKPPWYDR